MVSSSIDIASQALGLLRANTIASFDDGTNEADISKLYYNDFAQDILTRYQWNFALRKRQFNQTTAPLNEWRYAHLVPAETLRVWAVYNTAVVGSKPINQFTLQAPNGKRQVHSNSSTIYGEYTVYTDESNWPAYFTDFAVQAFAAKIAMPITDDPELASYWKNEAWGSPSDGGKGGAFSIAASIDALQQPPENIIDSPLINARFS